MVGTTTAGSSKSRWWRRVISAVAVGSACLGFVFVTAGSVASAKPTKENECISPFGVELNEFFGVSEAIVGPCTQVNSGQRWVVGGPWFMNHTFEFVPEGFEPAGETPLADFVAKFDGVRYVVDPGTAKEKTFVFPNSDRLFTGPGPAPVEGFPFASPITLGTIRPLSVGEHVVERYWVFNAMHCDGFSDVIEESCLPAGETLLGGIAFPFQVTPGHNKP